VSGGITLDTGALVALERRHQRILAFMAAAQRRRVRATVPAPVVAEWWRKRSDVREAILHAVVIEPMDLDLAKLVGEALAVVRSGSLVDATVIASASRRGDIVLTADVEDLQRLATTHFPNVRVLRV
jgi:predicted nucleic acid-binding protein